MSLWGKLFRPMHPVGIAHAKLLTKFDVCSPNNCQDIWNRLVQIQGSRDLGHAPIRENDWRPRSPFPRGSCVPNLKSLAQVIYFEDMFDCMPKSLGVI